MQFLRGKIIVKTWIVEENDIRLDKYLANKSEYSRSQIEKMLDQDCITVNDKVEKASYKVKENDKIQIINDLTLETNVEPTKMDLNIVYEDEDVLVVDKPSGLVVHPGSGNYNNTLANGLMYYTENLSDVNGSERPGIVHRIDKDTSGLLLVAKTNAAHQILAEDFKEKKVSRTYIALIDGEFPNRKAIIDAPIGRDVTNRKRMTVTATNSKSAVTHLTVLKRFVGYTLVELKLDTGRTHQIRVHMKYIGYPVHNDPVYSNKKCTEFGQFLHSKELTFTHPITHKILSFSSPLPKEFQDFLNTLEEKDASLK